MTQKEYIISSIILSSMAIIFWKWTKLMAIMIFLELCAMATTSIFVYETFSLSFLIILFSFFVSESMLLVSMIFSSMRSIGESFSVLSLW